MIDTPVTTIESLPEQLAAQSKNDWPPFWRRLALAVVMLISIANMRKFSFFLNILLIFPCYPKLLESSRIGIAYVRER